MSGLTTHEHTVRLSRRTACDNIYDVHVPSRLVFCVKYRQGRNLKGKIMTVYEYLLLIGKNVFHGLVEECRRLTFTRVFSFPVDFIYVA